MGLSIWGVYSNIATMDTVHCTGISPVSSTLLKIRLNSVQCSWLSWRSMSMLHPSTPCALRGSRRKYFSRRCPGIGGRAVPARIASSLKPGMGTASEALTCQTADHCFSLWKERSRGNRLVRERPVHFRLMGFNGFEDGLHAPLRTLLEPRLVRGRGLLNLLGPGLRPLQVSDFPGLLLGRVPWRG